MGRHLSSLLLLLKLKLVTIQTPAATRAHTAGAIRRCPCVRRWLQSRTAQWATGGPDRDNTGRLKLTAFGTVMSVLAVTTMKRDVTEQLS